MIQQDCICALATANGIGALGIVRISGKEAIKITNRIFKGKNLEKVDSHTLHYGSVIEPETSDIIDEVLVSVFRAPRTFTAEDLVEISCHGSQFIQKKIIEILLKNGCRMAEAGEFTQRAFLNGRIDLAQAEAVADLISAENKASHQIALNQMRGGFSKDLKEMRELLINFVALIELELDFSEEDVEFANREDLLKLIEELLANIRPLINSFEYGNSLKSGIPIALIGKPNAGKSTLLNALLNEERAIVSSIAGTTRDTIEEKIIINGNEFRLIDTAGIRETEDEIESKGIEKTYQKARESEVILYLFDKENTTKEEVYQDYLSLKNNNNLVVFCPTKQDLYTNFDWNIYKEYLTEKCNQLTWIELSVKEDKNLTSLKNCLTEHVNQMKANLGNHVVVNQRHWDELQKTELALQNAQQYITEGFSGDLISFHLRNALKHLGNITGKIDVDQDILGTIFGKFCIGK